MDERNEDTGTFTAVPEAEKDNLQLLKEVYEALNEKGYHPVGQIVGYLLSEDPTYITNYKNARALIRKIDREELLCSMVEQYLGL